MPGRGMPAMAPAVAAAVWRMKSRLSMGIGDLLVHRFDRVGELVYQRSRQHAIGALNLADPGQHFVSAVGVERDHEFSVGGAAMHACAGHHGDGFLDALQAFGGSMYHEAADMHFFRHCGFRLTGGRLRCKACTIAQLPGGPANIWYIQTRKPQPATMIPASTGAITTERKRKLLSSCA